MSKKKCCVPGCVESGNMHTTMHIFPNPLKEKERFNDWLMKIGGEIIGLRDKDIYNKRAVCHVHFEEKYCCRGNRITVDAVPTLNLKNKLTVAQPKHVDVFGSSENVAEPEKVVLTDVGNTPNITPLSIEIIREQYKDYKVELVHKLTKVTKDLTNDGQSESVQNANTKPQPDAEEKVEIYKNKMSANITSENVKPKPQPITQEKVEIYKNKMSANITLENVKPKPQPNNKEIVEIYKNNFKDQIPANITPENVITKPQPNNKEKVEIYKNYFKDQMPANITPENVNTKPQPNNKEKVEIYKNYFKDQMPADITPENVITKPQQNNKEKVKIYKNYYKDQMPSNITPENVITKPQSNTQEKVEIYKNYFKDQMPANITPENVNTKPQPNTKEKVEIYKNYFKDLIPANVTQDNVKPTPTNTLQTDTKQLPIYTNYKEDLIRMAAIDYIDHECIPEYCGDFGSLNYLEDGAPDDDQVEEALLSMEVDPSLDLPIPEVESSVSTNDLLSKSEDDLPNNMEVETPVIFEEVRRPTSLKMYESPQEMNEVDIASEKPNSDFQETLVLHHQGYLKEKLNSVLRSHTFCALCYETNKCLKSLDEQLIIVTDQWTQTTLLKYMYNHVFNQEVEDSPSGHICTECMEQLKQSYIFIKQSKLTTLLLDSYINDLTSKTDGMAAHLPENDKCKHMKTVIPLESDEVNKYLSKQCDWRNNIPKRTTDEIPECTNKCKCPKCDKTIEYPLPKQAVTEQIIEVSPVIEKAAPTSLPTSNEIKTIELQSKNKIKTKPCESSASKTKTKRFICELCSKNFVEYSKLCNHFTEIHAKVQCKICDVLVDEDDINNHLTSNHSDDIYCCDMCANPFYKLENVHVHSKVVHGKDSESVCVKCTGKIYNGERHTCTNKCLHCVEIPCVHKRYLDSFIEQKLNHVTAKVKCPDCEYVCRIKETFIIHANVDHLNNHSPYICDQCGQPFNTKYSLEGHIANFHKNIVFCKYCDEQFDSSEILFNHETNCNFIRREHSCNHCPASFNEFQQLDKHHKRRHMEVFPCNFCNREFPKEDERKVHVARVHSGGVRYRKSLIGKRTCAICKDVFNSKYELMHHIKTHQNESGNYNCKICNAEFKSVQTLESHNDRKHNEHSVICIICREQVKEDLLEKHLVEHKTDSEIKCDLCGRRFRNGTLLHQHMQRHLLLKPKRVQNRTQLKCEFCDYVAKISRSLESHVNRHHLHVTPYVCHICKKKFAGRCELRQHTLLHMQMTKRPCPLCGKRVDKRNLKRHMLVHKDDIKNN